MNSKLLPALLLGIATNLAAQVNTTDNNAKTSLFSNGNGARHSLFKPALNVPDRPPVEGAAIQFLDTLYQHDFSNTDGIVISPVEGENQGGFWKVGIQAQIGGGLLGMIAPFQSGTAGNGYAMFDAFPFGASASHNASLTIGPISIPTVENDLTLNFEQWYARNNDTASVWISTNGTDFTRISDNMSVAKGLENRTANPHRKSILINQLAGEQTVYIRFNFKGGYDYTWLVDDLTITESYATDLAIAILSPGDYYHHYNYDLIPVKQTDSIGFSTVIRNTGLKTATYTVSYEIKKGTTVLENATLDSVYTIEPGEIDTIGYSSNYIPADTGEYIITVNLHVADETDATPANNTSSVSQFITPLDYSPMNIFTSVASLTNALEITYSWNIGQEFFIKRNQKVRGIRAAIGKPSNLSGNDYIDYEFAIYELPLGAPRPGRDPLPNAIAEFRLQPSYQDPYQPGQPLPTFREWQLFEFPQPVELLAGRTYVVSVNYYYETSNPKDFIMYWKQDGDLDMGTWFYYRPEGGTEVDWWKISDLEWSPAIGLVFHPDDVGIEAPESSVKLTAWPVPASDRLFVQLEQDKPSAFELRLTDMNGRVVYRKTNASKVSLYSEQIGLEQIADGFYTLQVISAEGISTQKVVIAR